MVAYSFKKMFVPAIRYGLGLGLDLEAPHPKCQTIRAVGRRRHAQPDDELQLYTAMRTKQCELIGKARCVSVDRIVIRFPKPGRLWPNVRIGTPGEYVWLNGDEELNAFAVSDGFIQWDYLQEFWRVNHPGVTDFSGMIIRWAPC